MRAMSATGAMPKEIAPFDEPRGPLGALDADAEVGEVLAAPELASLLRPHPQAGLPYSRITRLRSSGGSV